MKLENLNKLYVEQLKDMYSVERQLADALPKMAEAATSPDLQQAFQEHLQQTKEQVKRIETIFESLDYSPRGHKCKGMEGIIEEGEEVVKDEDADPEVRDAALIAAAQRAEHYEIAGYGTVRAYAEMLGYADAVSLLAQSLQEEAETDQKLSQLAEKRINLEAMAES